MPKHTPGPWVIESENPGTYLVRHAPGDNLASHIARINDSWVCEEHGDASANARLIAAAPELAALLQGCADWFSGEGDGHRGLSLEAEARDLLARIAGGN